jgi:hypothetical protein
MSMLEPALALATYVANLRQASRLMTTLPPAARELVQAILGVAVFALKIMVLMISVYDLIDTLLTIGKTLYGLAIGFMSWVKGFGQGTFVVAKTCGKAWRTCLRMPKLLPIKPLQCLVGIAGALTSLAVAAQQDDAGTADIAFAAGESVLACAFTDEGVADDVLSSGFWRRSEFGKRRVYKRDDLIDPNRRCKASRNGIIWLTNLELMRAGRPPCGPDGRPIVLHHLTQTNDSPLAEVSASFNSRYSKVIHINPKEIQAGIDRGPFNDFRDAYWRSRAKDFE